jgi:hypothetical protein
MRIDALVTFKSGKDDQEKELAKLLERYALTEEEVKENVAF